MTDDLGPFANEDHALKAGMTIGLLIGSGIDAVIGVDEGGNYLNVITLRFDFDGEHKEIDIAVLP